MQPHRAGIRIGARHVARDFPAIPLYPRLNVVASRPDLCGFIFNPTADREMWNIAELDYRSGCE